MRLLRAVVAAAAMLVLPLITLSAQVPDEVVHGTVNIALGNQNGMVVLTDSMLTGGDGHQLPQPSQKLFKIDDRSVCAIAGFASAPAISSDLPVPNRVYFPDLNTNTSAIIHEYIRQSAKQPPQSIAEKVWTLGSLMSRHLSLIANVREALGNPTVPNLYLFQLIVAGYDTDGKPKIGRMVLPMKSLGTALSSERDEVSVSEVQSKLIWKLNGIPDVATRLLLDPKSGPKDSALEQYAAAVEKDGGRSLTLGDLKELAIRLAYYTAKAHPEVGGPNQIAIFQNSQTAPAIEQEAFPEPPKPISSFALIVDSYFGQSGVAFAKGLQVVCVRCSWDHMVRELDGNYFIGNDFRNSTLVYDGGSVSLGGTNHVVDSVLVLGLHANPEDERVKQLMRSFTWSRVLKAVPKNPEGSPAASNH